MAMAKLNVLALLLACAALGLAALALHEATELRDQVLRKSDADRMAYLASAVHGTTRPGATLLDSPAAIDAEGTRPTLLGRSTLAGAAAANDAAAGASRGGTTSNALAPSAAELEALVERSVGKRVEEALDAARAKEDKKPSFSVLAATLELTETQRDEAREEVLRGQRESLDLLATPTEHGDSLLEEVIEVAAKGIAQPGTEVGWGKFVGRLLTERVPGSDDTYAARLEAVKQSVRATFRRTWTPKQFAEFEAWGADPLENDDIEGSPRAALNQRIVERARALGANLPEPAGR